MPKAFLVDTTKCTACRGCQVACKEWKDFPAVPTKQQGSHQNPPDLTHYNFKLVRFSEHLQGDKVRWLFFPDQCRHCLDPPCMSASTVNGAIIQDETTGAVIYTEKSARENVEAIRTACPYDIPRQNPVTKRLVKCDMCIDRVRANLLPMCVKSCAMGAMSFGEREDILKMADGRLQTVRREFPKAELLSRDDLSVICLVADEPAKYHRYAAASAPVRMARKSGYVGPLSTLRNRIARELQG